MTAPFRAGEPEGFLLCVDCEVTRQWSEQANSISEKDGVRNDRGLEGTVVAWSVWEDAVEDPPTPLGWTGQAA